MIEIPLNASPEQLFKITLLETTYDIRVILNSRTGIWTIGFSQNGVPILEGVALVGGVDVLRQYTLPIDNMYIANLEQSNQDPGKDNLGTVARLFILTDEEVGSG